MPCGYVGCLVLFFVMRGRPPSTTLTDPLFPYPALFRSHEGLARRAADREEAVVAHDQHFVVAEVAHDALALCEVGGDALVLMIAGVRDHRHGVLEIGREHV